MTFSGRTTSNPSAASPQANNTFECSFGASPASIPVMRQDRSRLATVDFTFT